MSDYVIIEPDMQRAIERWENEGGWNTTAVLGRAPTRERSGPREWIEGADSRARTALVVDHLPAQGESAPAAGAA